jgi:hypothetical protein
LDQKRGIMDRETRELLAKLFTTQLEQLAMEKGIDCGEDPDRIDYLATLGKSDLISREDIERFIGDTTVSEKEEKKEDMTGIKDEDRTEEFLGEVERTLKDFKEQGSIFDKADDLLNRMQSNLNEGNLEGTVSYGVKGSGLIEDMASNYEKVRRAFVIFSFRQLLSDVKESGIDVGDAETMVSKAAAHFHHEENEELDDVLGEIAEKAEYLQREQAKELKKMILSLEEFIDQARDLGADTREAREFFRKAEGSFDSKIFKKVGYFVTKARKATEDARKDRIQGISDSLLFVRTILDDAGEIGADTNEAESLYSQAKSAFKEEDYIKCKGLIKDVEQLALHLQDAQIQKALKLRKLRDGEKEPAGETGKDIVEVEPEVVTPPQRQQFSRPIAPMQPALDSYALPPQRPVQMPTQQRARKARCPNCGRRFPIIAGKGPVRVECPYCGMRGMMP